MPEIEIEVKKEKKERKPHNTKVPDELPQLLEDMAKQVLKYQPDDIYDFLTCYVEDQLRKRDGKNPLAAADELAGKKAVGDGEKSASVEDIYKRIEVEGDPESVPDLHGDSTRENEGEGVAPRDGGFDEGGGGRQDDGTGAGSNEDAGAEDKVIESESGHDGMEGFGRSLRSEDVDEVGKDADVGKSSKEGITGDGEGIDEKSGIGEDDASGGQGKDEQAEGAGLDEGKGEGSAPVPDAGSGEADTGGPSIQPSLHPSTISKQVSQKLAGDDEEPPGLASDVDEGPRNAEEESPPDQEKIGPDVDSSPGTGTSRAGIESGGGETGSVAGGENSVSQLVPARSNGMTEMSVSRFPSNLASNIVNQAIAAGADGPAKSAGGSGAATGGPGNGSVSKNGGSGAASRGGGLGSHGGSEGGPKTGKSDVGGGGAGPSSKSGKIDPSSSSVKPGGGGGSDTGGKGGGESEPGGGASGAGSRAGIEDGEGGGTGGEAEEGYTSRIVSQPVSQVASQAISQPVSQPASRAVSQAVSQAPPQATPTRSEGVTPMSISQLPSSLASSIVNQAIAAGVAMEGRSVEEILASSEIMDRPSERGANSSQRVFGIGSQYNDGSDGWARAITDFMDRHLGVIRKLLNGDIEPDEARGTLVTLAISLVVGIVLGYTVRSPACQEFRPVNPICGEIGCLTGLLRDYSTTTPCPACPGDPCPRVPSH